MAFNRDLPSPDFQATYQDKLSNLFTKQTESNKRNNNNNLNSQKTDQMDNSFLKSHTTYSKGGLHSKASESNFANTGIII